MTNKNLDNCETKLKNKDKIKNNAKRKIGVAIKDTKKK